MIELKLIEKLAEKIKWQKRFRAAYDGELQEWSMKQFGENVKFYVAKDGDKELGFIRINDKSGFFAGCSKGQVWNITDAYVKPAYRGQGVLCEMITQAINGLNVKMIYMTTATFENNKRYYFGLGFTHYYTVQNGCMTWALLSSFSKVIEAGNDHQNRICA